MDAICSFNDLFNIDGLDSTELSIFTTIKSKFDAAELEDILKINRSIHSFSPFLINTFIADGKIKFKSILNLFSEQEKKDIMHNECYYVFLNSFITLAQKDLANRAKKKECLNVRLAFCGYSHLFKGKGLNRSAFTQSQSYSNDTIKFTEYSLDMDDATSPWAYFRTLAYQSEHVLWSTPDHEPFILKDVITTYISLYDEQLLDMADTISNDPYEKVQAYCCLVSSTNDLNYLDQEIDLSI